jgi:hypothetical protein
MHPDDDTLYRDLPTLQDVSDSETSDSDDAGDDSGDNRSVPDLEVNNTVDEAMLAHANRVHTTPPRVQPAKPAAAGRGKITSYWKVETAEERVVRLEKDAREYAERAEEVQLREVEEKRKKHAKAHVNANERMRQHRDRVRAVKIAEGWVPGMKRVSMNAIPHCFVFLLLTFVLRRNVLSSLTTTIRPLPILASLNSRAPAVNSKRMLGRTINPAAASGNTGNTMPSTLIGRIRCCGHRSRPQLAVLLHRGALARS